MTRDYVEGQHAAPAGAWRELREAGRVGNSGQALSCSDRHARDSGLYSARDERQSLSFDQ